MPLKPEIDYPDPAVTEWTRTLRSPMPWSALIQRAYDLGREDERTHDVCDTHLNGGSLRCTRNPHDDGVHTYEASFAPDRHDRSEPAGHDGHREE